jgi:putative ABC transport system permease protein
MPNATSVTVRKLMPRPSKELEDTLIKLHIRHASALLFPDQPLHVTAVILLLKRTEDTDLVCQRLQDLINGQKLDLEFKRYEDIRPFFPRMKRMIGLIFDFVFVLLVVMVAFLIYNTQSAGIVERLGEIGTLRAMGVTRIAIWKLLVLEGLMLGVIGGVLGILLAIVGDRVFQWINIVYIPPSVTYYAKLEVLVLRYPVVLVQAFLGALLCSVVSSAMPARKAARMEIVAALRHS